MTLNLKDCPIGIFDSGVGGLTVVKEILEQCPNEKIVYFGDTARLPYGTKSAETVTNYSRENIQFLLSQNVKLIIIACNTATAFALESLKDEFMTPILGVIDAGALKAVATTKNGNIGVLATKGTIHSNIYKHKILNLNPSLNVFQVACPLFVPLVEEGLYTHRATKLLIEHYLSSLKDHFIDTILLGCTHYPMLLTSLKEFFGDEVMIVDSAITCAEQVKFALKKYDLERESNEIGSQLYFVSDSPNEFQALSSKFLKKHINEIHLIRNESLVYLS